MTGMMFARPDLGKGGGMASGGRHCGKVVRPAGRRSLLIRGAGFQPAQRVAPGFGLSILAIYCGYTYHLFASVMALDAEIVVVGGG